MAGRLEPLCFRSWLHELTSSCIFIPFEDSLHISAFLKFLFLHLRADCSSNNPAQVQLRQELNNSLQIAEKFTKLYDELLQSYQEKMFNTSSLLKQLDEQFSWVSQLANLTQTEDPFYLQVTTVSPILATH